MANRLNYLDVLRGWAILLMFETHAYQAWCSPRVKTSDFYACSRMLGGLAAPLFLFLAGVSIVLMHHSLTRKGFDSAAIQGRLLGRGLWILAAAFLFRLQAFLFQWRTANAAAVLRVDVLNCIGLSLLAVGLVLSTFQKGRLAVLGIGAAVMGFATPLIYDVNLRAYLPQLMADYINGRPPAALFPIFPWMGFTLAGGAVGVVVARCSQEPGSHRRLINATAVLCAALLVACFTVDRIPYQLYPTYNFWLTSPQYFGIRLAVMGLMMVACYYWRVLRPQPRFSILEQLGRHSLLLYWVHVEIVYGRLTGWLKGHADLTRASLYLLLLTASMLALSFLPGVLRRRRSAPVTT